MELDKVVCPCMGITVGAIRDAVNSGASTFEEVQETTGAASVCGACTVEVQQCVDYFVAERDN